MNLMTESGNAFININALAATTQYVAFSSCPDLVEFNDSFL